MLTIAHPPLGALAFFTLSRNVGSKGLWPEWMRLALAFTAMGCCLSASAWAASPGLPFTEDFSNTDLRDAAQTTANWSTEEQALALNWRRAQYGAFAADNITSSDITTDTQPTKSIALGDVDGDGDLDVVAGNYNQPNRLYLNNGTADLFQGVSGSDITLDVQYTRSVALGDVDGDGDLDLVAGNYNQPNRIYLNNGMANPFSGVTAKDISADADATFSVALGDVDGDGDLDLVAGNPNQANRLYLNNGTADPFQGVSGSDITLDVQNTWLVALGDIDGDGDLDVVAGNFSQPNRLYLNNGTTAPFNGVIGTDITTDTQFTSSVALGDVDGDGDLDVVAVTSEGANWLYLNNGTANPFNDVSGTEIRRTGPDTYSVALGDVDGDGDLDLVTGNDGQPNRLYLNNGTADPFNGVGESDITTVFESTQSIALGDMDGDGDLDVVAGNYNQPNRIYLNEGTSNPFSDAAASDITAEQLETWSVALGDVDGDGDLDVVAGNYLNQANRLYLNNGTATPFNGVTGSNITSDAHNTESVALGDVDGDGDLDVVAGNSGQANRLYLNNGTANPFNGVTAEDISTDANDTNSVALGDVDGDGDLDLVVGSIGSNRLYLNNGTANPFNNVVGTNITGDQDNTLSVMLGDVDGDGDLDVVSGNVNQTNRLYLNNGTANPFNLIVGRNITGDARETQSIVLGDVDGDGDLDVVAGDYSQINRLYLNNGTSDPFSGVVGSNIGRDFAAQTHSIALGDVDGDGDLDVVEGNDFQVNLLYLNNGTADPFGGVVEVQQISGDSNYTFSMALGDVDGDGKQDVVAGNYGATNRLYLNSGAANPFNPVAGSDVTTDTFATYSIAVGDVDRDGNLDVVVGNDGQSNQLYLNNGTGDPFHGVSGANITADAHNTRAVALGDIDGDGDLDVVAGNYGQVNRFYRNNGTPNPFGGITGEIINPDVRYTTSIALGDVDSDGDLDVVEGNFFGQANRIYQSTGTADPFNPPLGVDITDDAQDTLSIAVGDINGDGNPDVVAGNYGVANRLCLNNGSPFESLTINPFNGVIGSDITTDAHNTYSIALGDVDGDGNTDLVAGNEGQVNRLYRSNGATVPVWAGLDITTDALNTTSVVLGDVDGDGDLDLATANYSQPNRLYLNNGAVFGVIAGTDITTDAQKTRSVAYGDVDGDGALDVIAGNDAQANRLYRRNQLYHTARGRGVSLTVDTEANEIAAATLTPTPTLPRNASVDYFLSNNGGAQWFQVIPGTTFDFPTSGSDLRWRAELRSLSPALTPRLEALTITGVVAPVIAPVIAPVADASVDEGASYTGPMPTLTQGTLPVTWSLAAGPSGMTINTSTGVVTWPSPVVAGSPHTITIRATNDGGFDDESWQLTVGPKTGVSPSSWTFYK